MPWEVQTLEDYAELDVATMVWSYRGCEIGACEINAKIWSQRQMNSTVQSRISLEWTKPNSISKVLTSETIVESR